MTRRSLLAAALALFAAPFIPMVRAAALPMMADAWKNVTVGEPLSMPLPGTNPATAMYGAIGEVISRPFPDAAELARLPGAMYRDRDGVVRVVPHTVGLASSSSAANVASASLATT